MSDEDGFGTLQVGVSGHDGVADGMRFLNKSPRPLGQTAQHELAIVADVQAQIGGDLLVAAAAGVKLEA